MLLDYLTCSCAGFWCLFIVLYAVLFASVAQIIPCFIGFKVWCLLSKTEDTLHTIIVASKTFFPLSQCLVVIAVMTDILKQQTKKITVNEKGFLSAGEGNTEWSMTGCSFGAFCGWMVWRLWQHDSKWFVKNDRESSKCLGLCLGLALGSAQIWRRVLSWISWVFLTLDLIQSCYCSRLLLEVSWSQESHLRRAGRNRTEIWSGLHRQVSLCAAGLISGCAFLVALLRNIETWELCWTFDVFSTFRIDLCIVGWLILHQVFLMPVYSCLTTTWFLLLIWTSKSFSALIVKDLWTDRYYVQLNWLLP